MHRRRTPPSRSAAVLGATLLAGGFLIVAAPAEAAVITVDTTAEAAPDGDCSVREAVLAAETDRPVDSCPAGSGSDVIVIPAQPAPYLLTRGPLTVRSDLRLQGGGVLQGDARDRNHPVVHVLVGGTLAVDGLTLTGGGFAAVLNDGLLALSAVRIQNFHRIRTVDVPIGAAGIENNGTATLDDTTFSGNRGTVYTGVAVENNAGATMTIQNGTFTGNSYPPDPYLILGEVVANHGTLALDHATMQDNAGSAVSSDGPTLTVSGSHLVRNDRGIVNLAGTAAVLDTAVVDNRQGLQNRGRMTVDGSTVSGTVYSWGNDGAVVNEWGGSLAMTHSAVTGNTGFGVGGILSYGQLWLRDMTIAANTAMGAAAFTPNPDFNPDGAGGLAVEDGTAELTNVTLVRNRYLSYHETPPFALDRAAGNLAVTSGSVTIPTVTIADTVVAGGFVDRQPLAGGPDCSGIVHSLGYNLLQQPAGCGFVPAVGDRVGSDPLLGPLADNGGPTRTLLPRRASPTVDAGSPAAPGSTVSGACAADDQRYVPRPRDGDGDGNPRCDIGAVERQPPRP